jgi:mono/diheme cytochrome c family protein
MRSRFAVAVLALSSMYAAGASSAVIQAKTSWDGVYTDAQSKRGEALYAQSCSMCHGPDLAGLDTAPALTGAEFNTDWNDLPLGDLFERMRTTMPADAPGTLSRQQYADIVSFFLAKGGFPAGQAELSPEEAALKEVKFLTKKP